MIAERGSYKKCNNNHHSLRHSGDHRVTKIVKDILKKVLLRRNMVLPANRMDEMKEKINELIKIGQDSTTIICQMTREYSDAAVYMCVTTDSFGDPRKGLVWFHNLMKRFSVAFGCEYPVPKTLFQEVMFQNQGEVETHEQKSVKEEVLLSFGYSDLLFQKFVLVNMPFIMRTSLRIIEDEDTSSEEEDEGINSRVRKHLPNLLSRFNSDVLKTSYDEPTTFQLLKQFMFGKGFGHGHSDLRAELYQLFDCSMTYYDDVIADILMNPLKRKNGPLVCASIIY